MSHTKLIERAREMVSNLRIKPIPLAHIIPVLNQQTDAIESLQRHIAELEAREAKWITQCDFYQRRIEELASQPAQSVPDGFAAVEHELRKAMEKYPTWPTDPLHAIAVLGEEFGELTKAALQFTYEPHKTSIVEIRKEAIQTAAMALRWIASMSDYQYTPCPQHEQSFLKSVLTAAPTPAKENDNG